MSGPDWPGDNHVKRKSGRPGEEGREEGIEKKRVMKEKKRERRRL